MHTHTLMCFQDEEDNKEEKSEDKEEKDEDKEEKDEEENPQHSIFDRVTASVRSFSFR